MELKSHSDNVSAYKGLHGIPPLLLVVQEANTVISEVIYHLIKYKVIAWQAFESFHDLNPIYFFFPDDILKSTCDSQKRSNCYPVKRALKRICLFAILLLEYSFFSCQKDLYEM